MADRSHINCMKASSILRALLTQEQGVNAQLRAHIARLEATLAQMQGRRPVAAPPVMRTAPMRPVTRMPQAPQRNPFRPVQPEPQTTARPVAPPAAQEVVEATATNEDEQNAQRWSQLLAADQEEGGEAP